MTVRRNYLSCNSPLIPVICRTLLASENDKQTVFVLHLDAISLNSRGFCCEAFLNDWNWVIEVWTFSMTGQCPCSRFTANTRSMIADLAASPSSDHESDRPSLCSATSWAIPGEHHRESVLSLSSGPSLVRFSAIQWSLSECSSILCCWICPTRISGLTTFQKLEMRDLTCFRVISCGQEEVVSDFPIPGSLFSLERCIGIRVERFGFDLMTLNQWESNHFVTQFNLQQV
jgi:hypothetical protein